MAVGEELWVGLGNGQVLIFDIIKNNSFEDEAYLVLGENKGKQKLKQSWLNQLRFIKQFLEARSKELIDI